LDYHDGTICFHVADAKENWNQCGSSMYTLGVLGDGSWSLSCTYNSYCRVPSGYGNPASDAERKLADGRGLKIDPENGNRFRIEVRGQRIQIWVDGEQIADVTDDQMGETIGGETLDHGGVGFQWGLDSMGWIRNFSVLQFQPAEADGQAASAREIQAFDETVKSGSEAWSFGDYSKALKLLLPAAQRGHPVAQHRLGVIYALGQGVEQDYAEATRWFRKAAEQGQGESQYSMGLRYFWGQSVAQDDKEAARWLKLAAGQGIDLAAAALKNRYATGSGVPRDLVEAYKWGLLAGGQSDPTTSDINLTDLEDKLTPEQLADAQRRAKEFVPKRTGPADP
jgi:hypothetical protein